MFLRDNVMHNFYFTKISGEVDPFGKNGALALLSLTS